MAHKETFMDRLLHRIGRRGAVLLLLSFVDLCIGIKAIVDPAPDQGNFTFYTFMPWWLRGIMWLVPAIAGVYAALARRGKNDGVGFSALCIPAAVMTGSYFVSFVGYLFGVTDYNTGWINALEWAAILVILIVTSGWTEVDHEVVYVSLVDKEAE